MTPNLPSPSQWAPSLWVCQSRLYATNSGLFIFEDQACLVDPCIFPEEIQVLKGFIEERHLKPHTLVLTHSDWDHILGPESFPETPITAHRTFPQTTREPRWQTISQEIQRWEQEHQIRRFNPFQLPQLTTTFTNTLNIEFGDHTLQLIHTPGHASDHLAIYHANDATLWAGDMLSDLEIPYVDDSLSCYIQSLEQLELFDIQTLVPGHGTPTQNKREIQTRFRRDFCYLEALQYHVHEALARGFELEEAIHLGDSIPIFNPELNRDPHRHNIRTSFLNHQKEMLAPTRPHPKH